MINEFRRVGNLLFLQGLVHSHSGNMSKRVNEDIFITKTGASLFGLRKEDIIKIRMDESAPKNVSIEYKVHKKIYEHIDCRSILHAHPPFTVALSFFFSKIIPKDKEGAFFFEHIDVLDEEEKGTEVFLEAIKEHNIVVIKGHGTFAKGDSLDEALLYTSSLEASSKLLYLTTIYKGGKDDKF